MDGGGPLRDGNARVDQAVVADDLSIGGDAEDGDGNDAITPGVESGGLGVEDSEGSPEPEVSEHGDVLRGMGPSPVAGDGRAKVGTTVPAPGWGRRFREVSGRREERSALSGRRRIGCAEGETGFGRAIPLTYYYDSYHCII